MAGIVRLRMSTTCEAVVGRRASWTPRTYWRTKPRTKVGTEMRSRETTRIVESNHFPRRMPAMTPRAMPRMVSMARA